MDELRGAVCTAVLVLVVVLAGALPVHADYEEGQRAWDAGRPDEALSHWRAAAEAGDRRAMLALGRLYRKGLGVLQSYVEAHKWLNLAASRAEPAAPGERDALAAKMTPEQVAAAQERAAAWRPGGAPSGTPGDSPDAGDQAAGPPPPRAIREAQALLGVLGYAPGPADGVWGRRSVQAYQAFLRDIGLESAQTLTPATLRVMRAVVKRRDGEVGSGVGADAPPPRLSGSVSARADTLHRAAKVGDLDGLKTALGAGVKVDARDGKGRTALMHAVDRGYVLLIEPLLAAGADPDLPAPDGATALFMAAAHGQTAIIASLMKAGADISVMGPQGRTAVDVARARYGNAGAAREDGVDAAVLALLRGRTLAELEEEKPGRVFRDCAECPELVVVPPGSFEMGSPSHEEGREGAEGPLHRVMIGEPIAVGRYEVTRGEWNRFASATGYSAGSSCRSWFRGSWSWSPGYRENSGWSWRSPGFSQDDRHPVVCVSWADAKEYVRWLSRETGKGYRLLSESEWEYVARAGTTGPYHFGSGISQNDANYGGNEGKTVPVGTYGANGFGLHDVHGNVTEWVEDCWHDDYRGAPSEGEAWVTGGNCGRRVRRGGSWYFGTKGQRSAHRRGRAIGYQSIYGGFRVARTLD